LGVSSRVAFLGWRDDLGAVLAGCDLAASASEREGSPNALLEAMGAGLPCLGSSIPEIAEILSHQELIFEVGNATQLADKLRLAADDDGCLSRMRELSGNRALAYAFDWDARLRKVIAELADRARRERGVSAVTS
jgi:glycosyltransferase involved in cell wall biosynthesis